MNPTPLEIVLLSIAGCVAALVVHRYASKLLSNLKSSVGSLLTLADSIEALRHAMEDAATGTASIPKLISGMTDIAKAQVDEYVRLRLAIDRFSELVVSPAGDKDAFTEYNEFEADKMYKRQQAVASGMTLDEAAASVEAEEAGKIIYTAPGE